VWPFQRPLGSINESTFRLRGEVPLCRCGAVARPNVSMHGDTNFSWVSTHSAAQKKQLLNWLNMVYITARVKEEPQAKLDSEINVVNCSKKYEGEEQKGKGNSFPVPPVSRSKFVPRRRKREKLVVLEFGCGVSLHSIRIESDVLVRNGEPDHVKLIRVNPMDCKVPANHIGVGIGALEFLKEIRKRLQVKKEEMSRMHKRRISQM